MPPQSLILITIDALRHDALGCGGSTEASTRNLDALAAGGVFFEQAISNGPRTQAAFPAIMASLYPLAAGERQGLPTSATTLAEAAASAGLATAGFNPSNPFLTRDSGYHRGFERFVDFWDVYRRGRDITSPGKLRSAKRAIHDAIGRRSLGFLMLLQALLMEEGGRYLTGRFLTDQALAWLAKRDGPFFLWLHYMDVHYPYQPLPGSRRIVDRLAYLGGMAGLAVGRREPAARALGALYRKRVSLVDGLVGDIIRGIDALGLADSTAVIVTADHGEQLGEHGRWAHGPDLHEELIRVPLVVSVPDLETPRRIDRQVELLGLAPTILDLLDIPVPPTFLGISFAPLILRGSGDGATTIFSEAMHSGGRRSRFGIADTHTVTSCREGGWKYIYDTEDGGEELYDLISDPTELTNLASSRLRQTARYRSKVEEHRRDTDKLAASFGHDRAPGPDTDDTEMRRRLAALGYL